MGLASNPHPLVNPRHHHAPWSSREATQGWEIVKVTIGGPQRQLVFDAKRGNMGIRQGDRTPDLILGPSQLGGSLPRFRRSFQPLKGQKLFCPTITDSRVLEAPEDFGVNDSAHDQPIPCGQFNQLRGYSRFSFGVNPDAGVGHHRTGGLNGSRRLHDSPASGS